MSDIALRVKGLGKRYRLGPQDSAGGGMYRYKSLRDSLGSLSKYPLRTLRHAVVRKPMDEDNSFWALKDVSFEVKKGEVVGIIGRNGAGKSTLLKVLSRITKPTTGRVDLFGRVGSLLEVGTGFHPELSGRENIYLNGAVLGMTRAEVKAKFDEIVAFSEIEKFLDTPVKQYSSGMYMRLAFAVAAHLESEILIVDEVLAVGDAEFQKKCMGKMREVGSTGRTVLFVSHNMSSISALCGRGCLLRRGSLVEDGPAAKVISHYFNGDTAHEAVELSMHPNRSLKYAPCFTDLSTLNKDGAPRDAFAIGELLCVRLRIQGARPIPNARVGIGFTNAWDERIAAVATYLSPDSLGHLDGPSIVVCKFTVPPLIPGKYYLDVSLDSGSGNRIDEVRGAAAIEIEESGYLGGTYPYFREMGPILVPSRWHSESIGEHTKHA